MSEIDQIRTEGFSSRQIAFHLAYQAVKKHADSLDREDEDYSSNVRQFANVLAEFRDEFRDEFDASGTSCPSAKSVGLV